MRQLLFCGALVIASGSAHAETDFLAKISEIAGMYRELDGTELTSRGAIGTMIGENLYFKNELGQFQVIFDAGREARRAIEGCELEWFGWQNSDCIVEIDAEISIDDTFEFSQGVQPKLIIFGIRRE